MEVWSRKAHRWRQASSASITTKRSSPRVGILLALFAVMLMMLPSRDCSGFAALEGTASRCPFLPLTCCFHEVGGAAPQLNARHAGHRED
jgi:hypothetical protein